MATRSNDTDPMNPRGPERREGSHGSAVTDPDPRPVISYEPPPNGNTGTRSLVDAIATRRAPPPVDAPTTDGDLAASYSVPQRPLPHASPPPAPQPLVLVEADAAAAAAAVVPSRRRDAPTVRISRTTPDEVVPMELAPRKARSRLLVGAILGATALSLGLVQWTVASLRGDDATPGVSARAVEAPAEVEIPVPPVASVPSLPPAPPLPMSAPPVAPPNTTILTTTSPAVATPPRPPRTRPPSATTKPPPALPPPPELQLYKQ